MKKKIFIMLILTLLLAPIKFNKGILINKVLADPKEEAKAVCEQAASGIKTSTGNLKKEDLISICTEKLLATDCKTEQCFKSKFCSDNTYAPLTTYCDNYSSVLKKVCDNAAAGYNEELQIFSKSKLLEYCMTALPILAPNCTTADCYKKALCDSQYGSSTSYCDKDISILKGVCQEAVSGLKWEQNGTSKEELLEECIKRLQTTSCKTRDCYIKVLCDNEKYSKLTTLCGSSDDPGEDSKVDPIEEPENPVDYDQYDAANCYGFGEVVYYISLVIKIFQIAAPILLIIWASVDLVKSIISSDEKKIIEKRKPIIQRFVAAGVIFLVPWIVETIVNGFSINGDEDSWYTCWENNHFKYSSTTEDEKKIEILKKYDNLCTTYCKNKKAADIEDCNKTCRASFHNEDCNKKNLNSNQLDSCVRDHVAAWYKDYFDEYLIQPK